MASAIANKMIVRFAALSSAPTAECPRLCAISCCCPFRYRLCRALRFESSGPTWAPRAKVPLRWSDATIFSMLPEIILLAALVVNHAERALPHCAARLATPRRGSQAAREPLEGKRARGASCLGKSYHGGDEQNPGDRAQIALSRVGHGVSQRRVLVGLPVLRTTMLRRVCGPSQGW